MGRRVNRRSQIETLLEILEEPAERAKRRRLFKLMPGIMAQPDPKKPKLRLSQGAIQKAVLAVMAEAKKPITVKDIHDGIERVT